MFSSAGYLKSSSSSSSASSTPAKISTGMDTVSHSIDCMTAKSPSGIILSTATSLMSSSNQQHRQRSDNEKLIRSGVGLTGSMMAFSTVPQVSAIVATGLAISEFGEMDMRLQKDANNRIYDELKKAGVSDEMCRDIIFDRCVGRIP